MKKIVVITMVKNEEDIIESFIRHSMTFADELILIDHDSIDCTSEILFSLSNEYNNLFVKKYTEFEYSQSECMTALMREAFLEHNADIVVPLDADEFLLPKDSNDDLRTLLLKIRYRECYSVYLNTFSLVEPNKLYEGYFILDIPSVHSIDNTAGSKIIISKGAFSNNTILAQGNHYIIDSINEINIKGTTDNGLMIAHFPTRGEEQLFSKLVMGWIFNVAKYTSYTNTAAHWKEGFERFCKNGSLNVCELDDKVNILNLKKYYKNEISIKYATSYKMSPVVKLAKASEKLANEYKRYKFYNSHINVSIALFVNDNIDNIEITMDSILMMKYPHWKLWIVYNNLSCSEISSLQRYKNNKIFIKQYDNNFSEIYSYGQYIQFLNIGDVLHEDAIYKSCITLEANKDFEVIYSRNGNENLNEHIVFDKINTLSLLNKEFLKNNCLNNCSLISGYMSSFFIRKSFFDSYNDIDKFVNDGIMNLVYFYEKLYDKKESLVHSDTIIDVARNYNIEALYYIKFLERYVNLQQDNAIKTNDLYSVIKKYNGILEKIPTELVTDNDLRDTLIYIKDKVSDFRSEL